MNMDAKIIAMIDDLSTESVNVFVTGSAFQRHLVRLAYEHGLIDGSEIIAQWEDDQP